MWRVLSLGIGKDKCHQTKRKLSAYIDQRLDLREREGVEQHLEACQECRQELHSLRAAVDLLHSVPQAVPRRSFAVTETRPLPHWAPFPALRVATAVLAVSLVLVFAADMTNLFQTRPLATEEKGASSYEPGSGQGGVDSYSQPGEDQSTLGPALNGEGCDSRAPGDVSKSSSSTADAPDQEDGVQSGVNGDDGTDGASKGEILGGEEASWTHPLEYGLLGVVLVLSGVTIVGWRKGKKAKSA